MGLGSFFKRGKNKQKSEAEEDCHIDINIGECDGCEKCAIACPNNVLVLNEGKCSVRNALVCKSCRVCVAICPNDCITVN